MMAFERRRNILRILAEQTTARVSDLAQALDVSEATILNDLAALSDERQLMRVRGGAVLREKDSPRRRYTPGSGDLDSGASTAKMRIARWAAELIGNGDAVLFDA